MKLSSTILLIFILLTGCTNHEADIHSTIDPFLNKFKTESYQSALNLLHETISKDEEFQNQLGLEFDAKFAENGALLNWELINYNCTSSKETISIKACKSKYKLNHENGSYYVSFSLMQIDNDKMTIFAIEILD